jgi:hypothetical protein
MSADCRGGAEAPAHLTQRRRLRRDSSSLTSRRLAASGEIAKSQQRPPPPLQPPPPAPASALQPLLPAGVGPAVLSPDPRLRRLDNPHLVIRLAHPRP